HADQSGQQTLPQLFSTEQGADLVAGLELEGQGQRTELQLLRQSASLIDGEGSGDRRATVEDRRLEVGSDDDLTVQHRGELVARSLQLDHLRADLAVHLPSIVGQL